MNNLNILEGSQISAPQVTGIPQVTKIMLPKGVVHQPHIELGSAVIKFGTAANLPATGSLYPVYFQTDSGILSIWNGTKWLNVTLS